MMIFVLKKSLREGRIFLPKEEINVTVVATIRLNMVAGTPGGIAAFSMNVLFVKVHLMVLGSAGLRLIIELKGTSIPKDMERAATMNLAGEKLNHFVTAAVDYNGRYIKSYEQQVI